MCMYIYIYIHKHVYIFIYISMLLQGVRCMQGWPWQDRAWLWSRFRPKLSGATQTTSSIFAVIQNCSIAPPLLYLPGTSESENALRERRNKSSPGLGICAVEAAARVFTVYLFGGNCTQIIMKHAHQCQTHTISCKVGFHTHPILQISVTHTQSSASVSRTPTRRGRKHEPGRGWWIGMSRSRTTEGNGLL